MLLSYSFQDWMLRRMTFFSKVSWVHPWSVSYRSLNRGLPLFCQTPIMWAIMLTFSCLPICISKHGWSWAQLNICSLTFLISEGPVRITDTDWLQPVWIHHVLMGSYKILHTYWCQIWGSMESMVMINRWIISNNYDLQAHKKSAQRRSEVSETASG
jgi:hypothetical protein